MIGKIVSNALEVIAPSGCFTLFWIHELQRSEVVLQNMLVTNWGAVTSNLVTAMKHTLIDFDNFAAFRQSTSIAYSLWERAFWMQHDQQTAEWTKQ